MSQFSHPAGAKSNRTSLRLDLTDFDQQTIHEKVSRVLV